MVNPLLTISIKVNIGPICRIAVETKGLETMKKMKAGRGFWSWLMGSGYSSGGGNG
jgi:hypothetical protein